MQLKTFLISATLLSSLFLSGCSDIISAGREQPIQEDPGSRTVGSYIDDELIETLALVNLNKGSESLQNANISVTSYNGIVLLTGQASNEMTKAEAQQIVSQVKKVRRVHNEVRIAGNASLIERTNDTWLTTKVKSILLTNESIDGGRVKVVTDKSVVYLMGLASTTEAEKITEIVRNIGGVEKIVRVFEYIQ